jgi:hypothetical protein
VCQYKYTAGRWHEYWVLGARSVFLAIVLLFYDWSGLLWCWSMYHCVLCNCTDNDDVKSTCYFNNDFVCRRTFRTMPDWLYKTILCGCSDWYMHEYCWHCCVIGLHIYTCTSTLWFNLVNPQKVSVPIHINCWRVACTLVFGVRSDVLAFVFLFCDWCGTKWCWSMCHCVLCNWTSNDDVKLICYFNNNFVCSRTFCSMPD